jgi:signal peptidase I
MLPCIPQFNLRLINASEKLTTLRLRSRMQLVQLVFFSKQASKATKFSDGIMSRTERRLLERKERNSARKKAKIHSTSEKIPSTLLKSQRFLYSLVPRLPGQPQSYSRSHLIAICYRLPLFLVLSYVLTDENTSPYIIQASLGPSMLPTIQFAGDIWVVETGAWGRVWRRIFKRQDEGNFPTTTSSYKVGDLLIWEDPKTGKRSCKRLIGLEGDKVSRYGEFGDLKYKYRSDFGILWPKKDKIQYNDNQRSKVEAPPRTLVVPENCVWLEGDCPLFSMDSRQYGPINVNKIRGRLVFRLWPWKRDELTNDKENEYLSSCWISRDRPVPYPSIEAYIGKRFGFYRLPSTSRTHFHTTPKEIPESN